MELSRLSLIALAVVLGAPLTACGSEPPKDTRPAFAKVLTDCDTTGEVEDDGSTLLLDAQAYGETTFEDLDCVLEGLDAPQSVVAEVESTRALDGRQSSKWDGFAATYTFHPDSGMNMVITKTPISPEAS
jgi:hypothetical protein